MVEDENNTAVFQVPSYLKQIDYLKEPVNMVSFDSNTSNKIFLRVMLKEAQEVMDELKISWSSSSGSLSDVG